MSYTTTDLVEAYLGIELTDSSSPKASTVETYISWVSDEIDHRTKNKYALAEVTEIIDLNTDTMATSANVSDSTPSYRLPYVLDIIQLKNKSVQEIKHIYFNEAYPDETPVWVEKTIGWGGQAVLVDDSLNLIDPGDKPRGGRAAIKVVYTRGKQVVPGFVEKLATRMVALEIMSGQQSQALTQGTGRIRVGDIEIDDPGAFSQSFIKQTQDQIDTYMAFLGTQNYYLV